MSFLRGLGFVAYLAALLGWHWICSWHYSTSTITALQREASHERRHRHRKSANSYEAAFGPDIEEAAAAE